MVLRGQIRSGVATINLVANSGPRNLGHVVDSTVVFDIPYTTDMSAAIRSYVISVGFAFNNARTYVASLDIDGITSRI